MAANMQHMAGAGQMMQQQPMRKPTPNQLQQIVYQNLVQHTQPFTGICWQANVAISDRMGKTMNLITNINLAMNGGDYMKGAEWGCNFEREAFHKSPTKEAYDQEMGQKIMEFFKRRQANEPNLQNSINVNAQAQAQAQAQAMMNMQMGRGMGQGLQQGFQPMQHPTQGGQMGQGQQQLPMGAGMNMGMGMANQAGRGMGPGQQMAGMPTGQGRPQQTQMPQEMARLSPQDRHKVTELATKMFNTASEQQKAHTRIQLQTRISPAQLQEMTSQGRDPLMWFYQNQAFQVLKANMNRIQQQAGQGQQQQGMPPNGNNPQAAMMQQQASQQSLRQQQSQLQQQQQQQQGQQQHGTANNNQGNNDFSSFPPNMESIQAEQRNGLLAQQQGQMVVPANTAQNRNPTPQPGGQNGANQQGPRPPQQQQPHQNMNVQQRMAQAAQQTQAQLQAQQLKQMQNQPGMGGNMQTSQSPGMNTLNTPVSRPGNNMNQAAGQGGVQFGDQRFNQGAQRPNNQTFQNMLANLPQEQRAMVSGLSPERLNEVMQRWQSKRQDMGNNGGQNTPGQMPNRPPGQMGQMGGQVPVGMQQSQGGVPMNGNQQQGQMPRFNPTQQLAMMDSMDLPPQVLAQLQNQIPPEIKKWGPLKVWLQQNNIPAHMRNQLAAIQQKQFQLILQRRATMMPQQQQQQQPQGQQPGQQFSPQQQAQQPQQLGQNAVNPGMQPGAGPGPNPLQAARQQMQFPPQILQATAGEIQQVRNSKTTFAQMSDDQLRNMVVQMKKQSWMNQQQQRAQQAQHAAAQTQAAARNGGTGQPGMQNLGVPQAHMQLQQPPQPNQVSQTQNIQASAVMGQNAMPQQAGQKQPTVTPEQMRNARPQPANNRAQPPNPSPAAPVKNLKRPSNDDALDVPETTKQVPTRPASQPNQQQQQPQPPRPMNPQDLNSLTPEQRALVKAQMNRTGQTPQQLANETMARLKALGQEEQRMSMQEVMNDIPMSQEEHDEMAAKLTKIVVDMTKIGRGLTKWYNITRDDTRAKLFFRMRWRILKQFADGEKMSILKNSFSIDSAEIAEARAMLEGMAKDLAANMIRARGLAQQQATPQAQNAQLAQQPMPQQQQPQPRQQPVPVPENARRGSQQNSIPKGGNKGSQAPPAPTTTQAPFNFEIGASSPRGNPTYVGKPKELNLHLPASRKKQKTDPKTGQTPVGATSSPQAGKKTSPDVRRVSETQVAHRPVLTCKEPECEFSTTGYSTEQALQQHILEEHTKPREDPLKFVQENLALALGLEPDGSAKKAEAASMSITNSKQGQTPVTTAATPVFTDGNMKRSASSMGKPQDTKAGVKAGATPKQADAKLADPMATDPWANANIDPEMLVSNLGVDRGLGVYDNPFYDYNALSYLTPRDTPESAKDTGSSEPNSDIPENTNLEVNFDWQGVDSDLLFNMGNTSGGNINDMLAADAALLFDQPSLQEPDWDDVKMDFSKPFQFDTSQHYYMATS
ncbi:hypothetical protein SNK04_008005 [Fusarium graminearum]